MIKLSGKRLYKRNNGPIKEKLEIIYAPNDKQYQLIYNQHNYPLIKEDNKLVWNIPTDLQGKSIRFHIEAVDDTNLSIYKTNNIVVYISNESNQIHTPVVNTLSATTTFSPSVNTSFQYPTYAMTDEHPTIAINNRTIKMPTNYEIVVSQDNLSQLLTFEINRYFDGVDFSDKACSIKYINANGDGGKSIAVNIQVDEERIILGWLLDNTLAARDGNVNFSIEFLGYNEHGQLYIWQTSPSQFKVEKGIWVDETEVIERYPSIIEDIQIRIKLLESSIIDGTGSIDGNILTRLENVESKLNAVQADMENMNNEIENLNIVLGVF